MNALALVPLVVVSLVLCAAAAEPPAERRFTNGAGMLMVRIEPGVFMMGQGEAPPRSREEWSSRDWDEAPAYRVRITRPFYLAAHEVTNAQYERFDPGHRRLRGHAGVSTTDAEPVTMITWQEAADFCAWLSQQEGRPYRLPTEAEWEYACRAGTATAYHTGDTLTPEQANVGRARDGKKRLNTTTPVGAYEPNAWGLYDVHGNVEEWCLDWYGPYEAGEQVDPLGRADGYVRVTRGGSYSVAAWRDDNARYCRSANRAGYLPDDANRCVGFRVVLGEMPRTAPLPAPAPPRCQRDVKQTAATTTGPDPSRPFFVGPRDHLRIPENSWGPLFSHWNHDTALCVCPNGDVLGVWYTTVSESGRELALAASRLRVGEAEWEPASLFFDVPDVNDHAPALLRAGRRIYHFSNQALAGWVDASLIMRVSEDSGATWSKPKIILRRERKRLQPGREHKPVSAFLARDGTLCVTCDGRGQTSWLLLSADGGRTWRATRGVIAGRHGVAAERDDGAFMAVGRGIDPMPMSISRDRGETWQTSDTPFPAVSVGQRMAVLKLASKALLLCSFDNDRRVTGSRGVFAALSLDDGTTWPHTRAVPGVGGYLSLAQAPNGVICLFGSKTDCAFNEAWLREGRPMPAAAEKED